MSYDDNNIFAKVLRGEIPCDKIYENENFALYKLLEDTKYLKTAYNQVQEKASAMDDGAKFLNYTIPNAIVEEWEKVTTDIN